MAAFARPHSSRSITISDGVFASASRTPDKMAVREGERSLTYAKLAERVLRVANMAHGGFGLELGARAAVLMPNRLEYLEIVCGLSSAGRSSRVPRGRCCCTPEPWRCCARWRSASS